MNNKHTPGKWETHTSSNLMLSTANGLVEYAEILQATDHEDVFRIVAHIYGDTPEIREERATVMCIAPEMLNTLNDVVKLFENKLLLQNDIDEIKSLLAKATK